MLHRCTSVAALSRRWRWTHDVLMCLGVGRLGAVVELANVSVEENGQWYMRR